MGRARLILREKIIDEEGNLTEFVIWEIPGRHQGAERVRYRLAFIRRGEQTPAVLYDNHDPKGHHRHVEDVEEPYKFFDVDGLLADFASDVRRVIGGTKWPRH